MKRTLLALPLIFATANPLLAEDAPEETCSFEALMPLTFELFELHHAEELTTSCQDPLGNTFSVTYYNMGEDADDDGEMDFGVKLGVTYVAIE